MNITLAQIYLDSIKAESEHIQLALNNVKINRNKGFKDGDNEMVVNSCLKTIINDCERLQKEIK